MREYGEAKTDDILADVFLLHPQARGRFRFDLTGRVSSRSYCTQYETDWNFVQRLMEEKAGTATTSSTDGNGHLLRHYRRNTITSGLRTTADLLPPWKHRG
ncbi:contractile injection system protein, VgrG/Pvc8 family [Massilia phosphatilytica]